MTARLNVVTIQQHAERPHESALHAAVTREFLRDFIPPDPNGRYSVPPCLVPECDRISRTNRRGLCSLHKRAWDGDESNDLQEWLTRADPTPSARPGDKPHVRATSRGVFVLEPLHGLIRLEMAYALQIRGESLAPHPARAHAFNHLVERLAAKNVVSILDLDTATVFETLGISHSAGEVTGLLSRTQVALRTDFELDGRMSLGARVNGTPYFYDPGIIQPHWLADLVDRWTKLRIYSERVSPQTAGLQVAALRRFSGYIVQADVTRPEQITRELLLDYMKFVRRERQPDGKPFSVSTVRRWLGCVQSLLEDVRTLEWNTDIPSSARYLKGELPERLPSNPRYLTEYVMAQIESEESLQRIPREDVRIAVRIMMTTGMRMSHVLRLEFSCLEQLPRTAGPSAWSLRFIDTKTRQAMRIPVRPDVAEAIKVHQARVLKEFGEDCQLLLPRQRGGEIVHIPNQTVHTNLVRWCRELDVRDESGAPEHVTAHRFRHTCGTRWINNNVPQHVVMKLLGHRSPGMTQVYAHLHDSTVRDAWNEYQRVNIAGERLSPPDGEVAEVEWMLENLSRATQALPNGYCALPIQQSCPHANACLSCDSFTTGPEFLDVLMQQRDHHEEMIEQAESAGQQRLAEINRVPFVNLTKMIEGLRDLSAPDRAED